MQNPGVLEFNLVGTLNTNVGGLDSPKPFFFANKFISPIPIIILQDFPKRKENICEKIHEWFFGNLISPILQKEIPKTDFISQLCVFWLSFVAEIICMYLSDQYLLGYIASKNILSFLADLSEILYWKVILGIGLQLKL